MIVFARIGFILALVLSCAFASGTEETDCAAHWRRIQRAAVMPLFAKGQPIHRPLGPHFEIDEEGSRNLELPLVQGLLAPYLSSTVGKKYLEWLLTHPSLDADEIRARQKAVQTIRDNPALRRDLEKALADFKDGEEGKNFWSRVFKAYLGREFKPSLTTEVITALDKPLTRLDRLKNLLPYVLPLGGLAGLSMAFTDMTAGAVLLQSFVTINRRIMGKVRVDLARLKGVMKATGASSDPLSGSDSDVLKELGALFKAAMDKTHPLGIGPSGPVLRRMQTMFPFTLIDLTFLSNIPLVRAVKKTRYEIHKFATLASGIAELDLYLALAKFMDDKPAYHFPEIVGEGPARLQIEDGHNPYLHETDPGTVPNSADFVAGDPAKDTVHLLTGPNARGKSTYLRMLAVNTVLAMIGAPVAAKSASVTPMAVLTSVRNVDSTANAQSTFKSEAVRIAELIKWAEKYPRSLIIIDEIFTGTSPEHQHAAEEAVIRYLVSKGHLAVIASHKRSLASLEGELTGFRNMHVSDSDAPDRKFRVEPGVSKTYNGFDVMREAGVPEEIVKDAESRLGNYQMVRKPSGG